MTFPKLVRDRIPELIASQGRTPVTRVATAGEVADLLREKLREEVGEYLDSHDAEELADVVEVVYALAAEAGLTVADLDERRAGKVSARGSFAGRIVLIDIQEAVACP